MAVPEERHSFNTQPFDLLCILIINDDLHCAVPLFCCWMKYSSSSALKSFCLPVLKTIFHMAGSSVALLSC